MTGGVSAERSSSGLGEGATKLQFLLLRYRESRLVRLSLRFALRQSDYGSIVPKEKVSRSVPGGCWMCSTTSVYVRDVRRTVQFPFGHSVFALGGVGGGMVGEKVIWPL